MANLPYENFFLENEIEDQFNSHLNLQQFCTVKNELEGQPGMDFIVHRYSATDSVEKVLQGYGNTGDSEASFTEAKYTIQTAQGRFKWYDEEAKKDPTMVLTGTRHLGTDMFNVINGDIYGEYEKAEIIVPATSFDFDAFVDAVSMFGLEDDETPTIFAFVAPTDVAAIRKALKDTLQYVEAYARRGYVGTVASVNIYSKSDATPGAIYVATKDAVTIFNKTGVEYEAERDANTRMNRSYVRKYYVVALTNAAACVKIAKGATFVATQDTEVVENKDYYVLAGLGYAKVTPADGDNPKTKGWYELGE